MTPREQFVQFAKLQGGKPYIYGANGPDAYDCSGLLCACLHAAGLLIGDHGADDLYRLWAGKEVKEYTRPGQVFFYRDGAAGPITHCMIGIDVWAPGRGTLVGARGGGATTTTIEAAWAARAAVCTVFSWYWQDNCIAILDPWED